MELYAKEKPAEVSLEEIEKSEDGKYWLVTLSFVIPKSKLVKEKENTNIRRLAELMLPPPPVKSRESEPVKYDRKYKLFKVDIRTGDVPSMKIRTL